MYQGKFFSKPKCVSRILYIIFLGLILVPLSLPVHANQNTSIEQEYTFESPRLESVKIDGQLYDRVIFPGAPNTGQTDHPALPCYGAHILIPYGVEIEEIEIIPEGKTSLGSNYSIEPVCRPYFLSSAQDISPARQDPDVYALQTPYPVERFEKFGIQQFHGYSILVIKLYPVEYTPSTGELSFYERMTVRATCRESLNKESLLRNSITDINEVRSKIDNPAELSSYFNATKSGGRAYDMMILTTTSLADDFQTLKDFHDTTGTLTEIHTLDMIGSTNPLAIRDYIRQQYIDNGIRYILLGGDDDIIPSRKLFVVSWEGEGAVTEYNMPGDFYYSCLDGTFNYDGDAFWGEPGDGEDGDEVDFFPEVAVGRVSANTPQEVANLTNKIRGYYNSTASYLQKVLLAGEQLTFGGWGEYGGYAMDEMVNYSDAHGFMTFAFSEEVYTIEKLYDYLIQPNNYWGASEIISRINSGVHIIDHLGHSGPGYAMRTDTAMLRQQLTNTEFGFIYAEGCSAGQFDLTDCWAEHVTTVLPSGAFACIANARLGLGSRSTLHPVHFINREFWDAIYRADEGKPQIGRALADARADMAYLANAPAIRWTLYETTLFGDPAVAIKEVRSVAISFPNDLPTLISPDNTVTFTVQATGIGAGTPLQSSGQLFCSIDGGIMESMGMSEISPNVYEATLPAVPCGSSIEYCVSVDESLGEKYYSPDIDSPHLLSPVSDSVLLFEDDFETNKGWSISGGLWQRGIPTGQGSSELQYPVPDPTEGSNGPNVFGYNLNGDYENNLGEMYLTSPAIDCTDRDNVILRFSRWLGVEQPIYDNASIMVSNDGSSWNQLWANYATIGDLEWEEMEYDISYWAANQPTVYIRFIMGPTDGGLRMNGWNIDDIRVVSYECTSYLCGDANGDADVNIGDAVSLIAFIFNGGASPDPLCVSDNNGDNEVNIGDAVYLINHVFSGGAGPIEPCCP